MPLQLFQAIQLTSHCNAMQCLPTIINDKQSKLHQINCNVIIQRLNSRYKAKYRIPFDELIVQLKRRNQCIEDVAFADSIMQIPL